MSNANLEKIRTAVASEAVRCAEKKDAEGGAELVTVMITGLALAISSQSRGSRALANDFTEAASQFLMNEVVRFQPMSEFMERWTKRA